MGNAAISPLSSADDGVDPSLIKHSAAFEAIVAETTKRLKEDGPMTHKELQEVAEVYERAARLVEEYFPGSLTSQEVLSRVSKVLEEYGCTPENTLFAQSICPDEINHEEGDITRLFTIHLGEVFHLGGLAGIPFTGKTGFTAFSHHIPDNGNLFVLFAPHVGISKSGRIGEYSRMGQRCDGKACGAAVAALQYCCEVGQKPPTLEDLGSHPFDYQMNLIKYEVHKKLDELLGKSEGNERQAELAYQMFYIVQRYINEIVYTDFIDEDGSHVHGRLILLGGIQVNMPPPMHDFFLPLTFEIRRKNRRPINMLGTIFGEAVSRSRRASLQDHNSRDADEKNAAEAQKYLGMDLEESELQLHEDLLHALALAKSPSDDSSPKPSSRGGDDSAQVDLPSTINMPMQVQVPKTASAERLLIVEGEVCTDTLLESKKEGDREQAKSGTLETSSGAFTDLSTPVDLVERIKPQHEQVQESRRSSSSNKYVAPT